MLSSVVRVSLQLKIEEMNIAVTLYESGGDDLLRQSCQMSAIGVNRENGRQPNPSAFGECYVGDRSPFPIRNVLESSEPSLRLVPEGARRLLTAPLR